MAVPYHHPAVLASRHRARWLSVATEVPGQHLHTAPLPGQLPSAALGLEKLVLAFLGTQLAAALDPSTLQLRAAQHLPSGSMEHVFHLEKTRNKTPVTSWADAALTARQHLGKVWGLSSSVRTWGPSAPDHEAPTSRLQATYRAMVPQGSLHFQSSL